MTTRPPDPFDPRGSPAGSGGVGDELALRSLIELHRSDLRLYCYLMLGCPVKADAALRETVRRARYRLGRAGSAAATRTWLYRIATGACTDELRDDG
ncbi:MAG TPA: sigma factor [Solirubrobacteraceae bacterium]|jgi:RNA polymerase sigma-70 factor (ECF subfamily)